MKSCWLPQLKVKICEVCECAMCAWTIVQYNVSSYYSITTTRYNKQCQLNILKVWVSLSWWVHGVDNEVIITDQNVLLRCCPECSVSKYGQEAGGKSNAGNYSDLFWGNQIGSLWDFSFRCWHRSPSRGTRQAQSVIHRAVYELSRIY